METFSFKALFNPSVKFYSVARGRVDCDNTFRLGPRTIHDHLIYYLEKGEMAATVKRKSFTIPKESLFWLQPDTEHTIRQLNEKPATVCFFRFYLSVNDKPLRLAEPYILSPRYPSLLPHIHSMLPENSIQGDEENQYLLCQLATLLMKITVTESENDSRDTGGLRLKQRKSAIAFMRKNLSNRLSMDDLAYACGLNSDYFSRQFKKSFRLTPQEWIKRERIRAACDYLLESGLNTSEIAQKLGYQELSFFSRQFKEVMGKSPMNWISHNTSAF
ncbi:MAG: helix-turn-helix transcriptional regulator [Fibrobacteres bacterium]|nr:helix-turn-helix transcriptional regulator [Fibrobacterota bacterium]